MNLDRVIAVRNNKTIYRDGDRCIKVFNKEYSKADVLNEALNQARIEETGLNIPKVLEVTMVDGKWAIVSEFIKGKTLAQLMAEDEERKEEYIEKAREMYPSDDIRHGIVHAQLTTKDFLSAKATEESAARVTALISAPCAVGLAVLAQPITALLGGYTGDNLVLATKLMTILGFSIMFNAVVLVTTAIMQAHGHAGRPVINMLIGGVLKLAAVFLLTGNPNIGIVGTPIGSLLCYLCITILNLLKQKQN